MTDLPLSYPGGLTDNPPSVLTATQLVNGWLNAESLAEWKAPDGSDVYRFCVIDLDYEMAYLLRVAGPESDYTDMLAVFVRHGRHPERGWDFDVEWRNKPIKFAAQDREWLSASHHWFVEWSLAR